MTAIPETIASGERSWGDTARLYLDITRPKVLALVLFTGIPALALGGSWPDPVRSLWILLGTAFAGGSCSALNAWWERDIDARMARTRRRPLPASAVVPNAVLAYGIVMGIVSTAILAVVGGPLAAAIGLGTILFYFGVYTVWLKPRTPQNIVIGGAAGATAPLIAAAAATGHLPISAIALFLVIFLWTPPHFWAIAIYRKADYAAAGLPMMPAVIGDQPTRWRSLAYGVATVVASLVPWWVGDSSLVYAIAAVGLGAWFLGSIVRSLVISQVSADRTVFRVSIAYLTLVILVMLVDLVVPWGHP